MTKDPPKLAVIRQVPPEEMIEELRRILELAEEGKLVDLVMAFTYEHSYEMNINEPGWWNRNENYSQAIGDFFRGALNVALRAEGIVNDSK